MHTQPLVVRGRARWRVYSGGKLLCCAAGIKHFIGGRSAGRLGCAGGRAHLQHTGRPVPCSLTCHFHLHFSDDPGARTDFPVCQPACKLPTFLSLPFWPAGLSRTSAVIPLSALVVSNPMCCGMGEVVMPVRARRESPCQCYCEMALPCRRDLCQDALTEEKSLTCTVQRSAWAFSEVPEATLGQETLCTVCSS